MLTPDHDKIPPELKNRPQWVCWSLEEREGKPAKVPRNPRTGSYAKVDAPTTWGRFDEAVSRNQAHQGNGIGFMFSEDDPFSGVDLDACRDLATGELRYCAQVLLNHFDSYSEVSPSEEGIHTIVEGGWPLDAGHKKALPCGMKIEIYDRLRYFTVSGHHLEGTPPTIEARQAEIEALHFEIFGKPKEKAQPQDPDPAMEKTDSELVTMACEADDGGKFKRLWHGDVSGYGSHSEADFAFCLKLAFWTQRNAARMDRLFRESGLCKDRDRVKKWDRLSAKTIEKAIENTTKVYTPGGGADPNRSNETGQGGEAQKEAQDTGERQEQKKKPTIIEITGAELSTKEFPEPRWAVDKLIPEGYGVLGGRPKIGKSWLALETALAVAKGGFVIGSEQYQAKVGSVRYLALEDTERRIKNRQHILLCGEPGPENLFIVTKHPRLDQGGIEALDTWLTAHPDCRLVVIDTLAKVKPKLKKGNDPYDHDMDYGGQLQDLANKHRICLLTVHHTRKTKSDTDDFIDELAGSTGITGAPDFIMVLSRPRNDEMGFLHSTGRDVEEMELAVKFTPGQGTWTLLGPAQEYKMSQQRLKMLNALKNSSEALTPKDIAEITGIPHGSVKHLISELYMAGLIHRVGYGQYEYKDK